MSTTAVRPDGSRATFFGTGTMLVETRDGRYLLESDDLPERVELDPSEVIRAAAGLANLVAARLHDARTANRLLDQAIARCIATDQIDDDPRGTE